MVVQKLRQAGAVILGKLSTHEFAIGGPSFRPAVPAGAQSVEPGASSGRLVIRLRRRRSQPGCSRWRSGRDTGGSVRNPASACGIVGLKPTYGLVSRRGVFPLSFTLDHVGPMTRTVADNALLLDAIAGHDPADPGSAAHAARGLRRACWTAACATCGSASSGTSTRPTCRRTPR